MEVQCFEMWGKVKLEKLQNDPNLVSHSILFLCWWKSFPMSLSLLSILTWTLTWIQTNVCTVSKQTTNKQTNKDVWAFKKRTLNHLISQNVHHINHNKGIKKLSGRGLICIDFHAYCHRDLWFHQCSLISNFQWYDQCSVSGGRPREVTSLDDPSACTTARHRILMLLMSWPAENKRHDSTQMNMFFMDSSWPLHGVHFAAFQLRPYPIFRNTALSLME